jgi:hypothetical protein
VKNRAGDEIFEKTIGNDLVARLLAVRDRFIDVRIPIEGLRLGVAINAEIQLEQAE